MVQNTNNSLEEKLKYAKKGITLIALIITIIVLLILTGITIATLAGENGILTQANKAKEQYSDNELKERLALAVQSLLVQDSYQSEKITAERLKSQLKDDGLSNFYITGNNNLIVTFTTNNNSYVIKQNGEVLENNIQSALKQGDFINYNSDSLSGGENWRVFYKDNGTVNIVSTNPTEIVQATNNGVTEESEEKARKFEELLKTKRTEKVSVTVGKDPKLGEEIVTKELNYFSPELAKNYSLTITMEDIQKAVGISYTIGESVSREELKKNDINNLFPLTKDCYLIGTYMGDLGANKNSLYMVFSNDAGLGACWLLQSAFPVGTKIRPIVQLKENLEIIDGDGSLQNPYILREIGN